MESILTLKGYKFEIRNTKKFRILMLKILFEIKKVIYPSFVL